MLVKLWASRVRLPVVAGNLSPSSVVQGHHRVTMRASAVLSVGSGGDCLAQHRGGEQPGQPVSAPSHRVAWV